MESLEYVQAYLDDFLYISRKSIEDNLVKLDKVLRQLCGEGLKSTQKSQHSVHLK